MTPCATSTHSTAIDTRIETLNQLRHIIFTASPKIRAKFTGLTAIGLTNTAAALKPRHSDPDQVRHLTLVTIRTLGRRAQYLREETKAINRMLRPLIRTTAPGLLEVYGIGYTTAAKLLVAVHRCIKLDTRPLFRRVRPDGPAEVSLGFE